MVDLAEDKEAVGKVYIYPVSVEGKTYVITVSTNWSNNWSSAPEVYLPELDLKYVSVDFRGSLGATVFFNVTIPADLIWGKVSVVWKYYKQSADRYILFL